MNVIPTLSSKGYAKTPEEKLDAVLLYYQTLNPSMTVRYKGKIRSLQNAIWEAGTRADSMEVLARIVKSDLTTILGNNFPEGTSVDVTAIQNSEDSADYDLRIGATVIEKGKEYDLATSMDRIESRFMESFDVTRTPTL